MSNSSKLLLGLGIGTVVGGLLGFMANSCKGRKLRHDLYCAAQELESDAEQMVGAAKAKAEKAGAAVVGKVADKAEVAKEKVNEWVSK